MATSGNALFDRRCRLTIAVPVATPGDFSGTTSDVIEVDGGRTDAKTFGHRIQFKIDKTLEKQPNTSQIVVTNLAPTTRSALQKKGVKVLLEAGYRETGLSRIFVGDARTVDHKREKADWSTIIKLGDGERAWRFARVSESFSPGTRASDVIKKVARASGLDLGNVDAQADKIGAIFDQGYVLAGSALRALDKLATSFGKVFSVQDGQLQILDPYEALDLPIPEITPETGLVGSPEMGTPAKPGQPALVQFTSLLISTKPGAKVKLKSERYDGFVLVQKCSFEGDTHGGNWYTKIDGTIST